MMNEYELLGEQMYVARARYLAALQQHDAAGVEVKAALAEVQRLRQLQSELAKKGRE